MRKFILSTLSLSALLGLTACGQDPTVVVVAPQLQPAGNEQLLSQKQALEDEKAQLEKQLAEAKAANVDGGLQDKLNSAQADVAELTKQLADATAQGLDTDEIKTKLAKAEEDVGKMQNEIAASEEKVRLLTIENNKLKEQLATAGGNAGGSNPNSNNGNPANNNASNSNASNSNAGNNSTPQSQPQQPPQAQPPQTPSAISLNGALDTIKATTLTTGQGTTLSIVVDNTAKTANGRTSASPSTNEVTLDGTKIFLLKDDETNISIRSLTASDFENSTIPNNASGFVGSKYGSRNWNGFGQLRYGVYNDGTGKSHLFVNGSPASQNIFNGNQAKTFKGSAVIGKDGVYRALDKKVVAVMDADRTKVDIAITAGNEVLNFSGNINKDARTFSGTGTSGRTEGGFFGYAELGGFFEVTNGTHQGEHGVYGASFDNSVVTDHP